MNKKIAQDRRLVLNTRISERKLIIYVIESTLADETFPKSYKMALKDEIENHKIAIEEYERYLNQLK